ncbi:DUF5954 family protein [Streptomyces xylophagus]|uniref:DUF5954 family protein n=1 Tax=Streptomyces xylophagus TaxID=285514 RepID=UPI0005B8A234|nr:DUF5954 family protein [Streptomyces xylophagus]
MSEHGDQVPGYRMIRMEALPDAPAAALADVEAWQAREAYPNVLGGGGPVFGVAEELETGGWRIVSLFSSAYPQGSRDTMAMTFRERARDAGEAGDTAAQQEWLRMAERLDWEPVNELAVLGRRFRVVRADQFIRMGPTGPEPPRPSDPDPAKVGHGHEYRSRTKGFVIDPFTATGMSEGILRMELLSLVHARGTAPAAVRKDSRRALETHPGGVLLPAEFTAAEYANGGWQPTQMTNPSPQGSRDTLTTYLRVMAPVMEQLDEETRAEYARLADRIDAERCDEIEIDGCRTRIVRVERLVRVGPDGPEGPRPSDPDPELPTAVQEKQLREQGLLDEDRELSEEEAEQRRVAEEQAKEFLRLFEEQRLRREAAESS